MIKNIRTKEEFKNVEIEKYNKFKIYITYNKCFDDLSGNGWVAWSNAPMSTKRSASTRKSSIEFVKSDINEI